MESKFVKSDAKTCRRCGKCKPPGGFYKNQSRCKECQNSLLAEWRKKNKDRARAISRDSYRRHVVKKLAANKRYYLANRERLKAIAIARHRRLKDEAFAAYGGYVCVCCGEGTREFLQLDNKNNDGAKHRKEVGPNRVYYWLKNHGYPPIMQVLCANCNMGKRMNGGVCPHEAKSARCR
jgi:hypothetical protein